VHLAQGEDRIGRGADDADIAVSASSCCTSWRTTEESSMTITRMSGAFMSASGRSMANASQRQVHAMQGFRVPHHQVAARTQAADHVAQHLQLGAQSK
jgi:hypothetical protein